MKTRGRFMAVLTGAALLTAAVLPSAQAQLRGNIIQTLERDGRFTTLLAAVDAAGLKTTLASGGVFTLFAPTDAAFAKLPPGTVESLITNVPALTDILLYHVLPGRQSSARLLMDSTATTLEGNSVLVLRDGWKVTVNQQRVIRSDRWAANGLIHIVDGVLLPPSPDLPINSLVDVLKLDGRFNTLLTALEVAGLKDTVATGGVFTLFAPTDAAFAALPPGTVESLLTNVPALQQILYYHAVSGTKKSWELLYNKNTTTLEGSAVKATLRDGRLYINDAKVVNPNVKAPNGIIQVIDKVLLPPPPTPNLLDLLKTDGRFTTLVTALELTGLDEVVETGGPLTVFAPTDEAFNLLPAGALAGLIANTNALKEVLLYHVVVGEKSSLELLRQYRVPTVQGESVLVRLGWDGKVYVNRARVLNANVDASNGIAHVINGVLLPPTN